jgi:ABC-type uncharacterized transport system substrate-binding protein
LGESVYGDAPCRRLCLRELVEVGGVMNYGLDRIHPWQRAAVSAAKLGGGQNERPAGGAPAKGLVINLRIVRALGIMIPAQVMALVDDVIE